MIIGLEHLEQVNNMVIISKFKGCFNPLKERNRKPTAIVIHHTCTKSPAKTREILKKKKCSTHYEVDTNGDVYCYADDMDICSHCGSCNIHAIGIDVTHMSGAEFPSVQVEAVRNLVDYLCAKWGISHEVHEKLEGIWPHRAIGCTECPQNFPMKELDSPKHTNDWMI